MGPQLDSCGRHVIGDYFLASIQKLQWGRNLTVAEGAPLPRPPAGAVSLQWGRNLTVAEGGRDHCRRNSGCGFNGAAT